MNRYFYEPGVFPCDTIDVDTEDRVETIDMTLDVTIDGFLVFDRLRGHVDDKAIALCLDHDHAQKIVDALNALEELQALAKNLPSDMSSVSLNLEAQG